MAVDERLTILRDINNTLPYAYVQGRSDGAVLSLRRNINVRQLLIQNTSRTTVGVTIGLCGCGKPRHPQYTLREGEQVAIAVNPNGETQQFIWLSNYRGKQLLRHPHPIRSGVNDMAIHEGIGSWFIIDFTQPSRRCGRM